MKLRNIALFASGIFAGVVSYHAYIVYVVVVSRLDRIEAFLTAATTGR